MPPLPPFKLERYFAQHEFRARYLLSASDCESLSQRELLALADDECLALWNDLRLSYTESAGHPLLRAEVAQLYTTRAPDDVLILTPEEGIFIALHTLLEAGDHVIAVAPAYQSLHEVVRAKGCALTLWPLLPTETGWRLDLDHLAQSFTPQTRLLIINFPHNPTGYLPTRAEFNAILQLAHEHNIFVFSDEMYRGLEFNAAQRLPAVCDVYEHGISLAGLSKSFAAPGLRLGWLATPAPGWIDRWLAFKDYTTICHNAPSEILGLIAVRAYETLWARNVTIVQNNLHHAAAFCAAYPRHFRWLAPVAGSTAFPQWLGPHSADDFCHAVLDAQSVMVVPASMFDDPGPHVRFGLGRKNFAEALTHVADYLAAP